MKRQHKAGNKASEQPLCQPNPIPGIQSSKINSPSSENSKNPEANTSVVDGSLELEYCEALKEYPSYYDNFPLPVLDKDSTDRSNLLMNSYR